MMANAYAVHLLANAVHPSGAPDVHDAICSTLEGKCSNPMYMMAYTQYSTLDGKCSTSQ